MLPILNKIHKIFLVSTTILLMPFLAAAQKMEKPVIDKFTNDTSYFTTTEKISGGNGAFSSSNEDLKAYLSAGKGMQLHFLIELSATSYGPFLISSGNQIILKLADNSIINLSNIADVQSEHQGGGTLATGRKIWVAQVSSVIAKNDLDKMLASAVVAVRIQTDQGNIDFDIKPKDRATLTKMFQLVVNIK